MFISNSFISAYHVFIRNISGKQDTEVIWHQWGTSLSLFWLPFNPSTVPAFFLQQDEASEIVFFQCTSLFLLFNSTALIIISLVICADAMCSSIEAWHACHFLKYKIRAAFIFSCRGFQTHGLRISGILIVSTT